MMERVLEVLDADFEDLCGPHQEWFYWKINALSVL